MSIGEKIKALRTEEGLTMRELAELSKVNYIQIHKIENGTNIPSVKTANKILAPLGYEIGIIKQAE